MANKNSEEHSKISGDLYNEDLDGEESSFNPSESTKQHNKHAKKLKHKKDKEQEGTNIIGDPGGTQNAKKKRIGLKRKSKKDSDFNYSY